MTDSYKGADGNEIYFIDHRYAPKLKKRVAEKRTPRAKTAIYNLQGLAMQPEVKKQEQKIITAVEDSKKREV